MSGHYLGIDLGTSGLKAVVVDGEGGVRAETEVAYEVARPAPGRAEIAPQVWEDAVAQALAQLGEHPLTAVGVAGQMHGVVLMDSGGNPCGPAILWPDRRAEPVLDRWRDLSQTQRARLANPLVPGMTGPILDWLQQHEPQTLERAAAAVQPKDYVRHRLGGPIVTERSDASATLLWDVPADTWAVDVADALGVPAHLLAQVVPSDQVVGVARLPGNPALVAGAGDTPAALLGSGGLAPGEVQVNLGSGAQILVGVEAPAPSADPVTHLYADADSAWYGMCAIQNGGLALDRVRQWLGMRWDEVFAAATAVPAGARGVSMLPFLSGERGGVASPGSRGTWLGLTDATSREDLARAAVEAMVFTIRRGVEVLVGTRPQVRVTGGGARNPVVAQMLAAALGATVTVVPERSASALGAAMLAAAGVGALFTAEVGGLLYEPVAAPELEGAYARWVSRLPAAEL